MIELQCSSWDYFEYNTQGPRDSKRSGERMFIEVYTDTIGPKIFMVDCDFRQYLVCSPAGRVVKSGKYKKGKNMMWNAKITGVYLLKLWVSGHTPDIFNAKFENITSAKVKIWSKLSSNKDGTLFQGRTDKDLRNDLSQCGCNTRRDRVTK